MNYILLVLFFSSPWNNATIHSQQISFETKALCENAADALVKHKVVGLVGCFKVKGVK